MAENVQTTPCSIHQTVLQVIWAITFGNVTSICQKNCFYNLRLQVAIDKVYFTKREYYYFRCDNSNEVIKLQHRCNNVSECTDGSDEKNCQNMYFKYEQTCGNKSCNVSKFVLEKVEEGIEFRPHIDPIKWSGDTWTYKNCTFTFNKAIPPKSCPHMPRAQCYVYNGGICCAKKCNAVTCKDEMGNKYFEGATWKPNACTQCKCDGGVLQCYRTVTQLRHMQSAHLVYNTTCRQPDCNVWKFTHENYEQCEVCKWEDKYYAKNSKWTIGGIPFHCCTRHHKAGCYIEYNMIECTGSYPGRYLHRAIKNTSIFSSSRHFLCQSGDQVIQRELICNGGKDCYDGSDELLCKTYRCPTLMRFNKTWKNGVLGTVLNLNCSDVNSNWTGLYHAICIKIALTAWTETCLCENKTLVEQMDRKTIILIVQDLFIIKQKTSKFSCKPIGIFMVSELFGKVKSFLRFAPLNSQSHDLLNMRLTKRLNLNQQCLIMTLSRFYPQRLKKSKKTFIHKSLMLSLCMANVVYMVDVVFTERNNYPAVCAGLAVVQHYFHTAVFTWMLAEAFYLYSKVIQVFANYHLVIYIMTGWGIPGVLVTLTAAAKWSVYDMRLLRKDTCFVVLSRKPEYPEKNPRSKAENELTNSTHMKRPVRELNQAPQRCWLNDGYWIYNGPILAFLLINLVLFILLLRVAFGKIASRYQQQKVKKIRKGLKCIAALLPLLGVSWLLGFTVNLHWVLAYIFIIINSSQVKSALNLKTKSDRIKVTPN
ncbi:hypothetical protein QZH41_009313, partial [Actinostola sp. cb2023]